MNKLMIGKLLVVVVLIISLQSVGYADAWRATDSAHAYGRSPGVLAGSDSPAAGSFIWFAANFGQHDMWLYDYDSNVPDQLNDFNMNWSSEAIERFRNDPSLNVVHQIIVDRNRYEADSYFSSNFPHWSHNEDESELEEALQGYEEKEVGTLYPERFADYPNIEVVTRWAPLSNGSNRFTSETELTKPTDGHDEWYPNDTQSIGIMDFTTPAPKPDLTTTSLSVPSSGQVGGSISVSAGIFNQQANDSGGFLLGFYLSADPTITTGDRRLASCSWTSLGAGAISSCSGSITIPSDIAPGSYYLGVIADYEGRVAEANEVNNTRASGSITLTGPQPITWGFNTNGNIQGWTTFNLAAWLVNNGVLFLDPNGGDFYVSSPAISATASTYRYVRMNMASNAADGTLQIYFKTDLENFYSQDKLVQFSFSNCSLCGNAAFNTRSFYMGGHAKWRGRITGIRIDPALSGTAGTNRDSIGIDFISLQTTP